MKVAFLTEFSEIGGGEKNLLYLAKELSKQITLTIFCPKGKLFDQSKEAGLNVRELKGYNGKRWIRFIPLPGLDFKLRAELKQFDIAHVYSLNMLPKVFFAAPKIIWTTHGYWERPFGLRAKLIEKIADKIITVSGDVDNTAIFSENKKRKIFLGIPVHTFSHKEAHVKKENETAIVCIGRFQRIKGQDLLIKAAAAAAAAHPEKYIRLYIVGDVNGSLPEDLAYKNELLELSSSVTYNNLNIEFAGFQANVSSFLNESDFAVIPSRYESFSITAVEALASGLPVVGPEIGGLKDIITNETGIFFHPGDLESLTLAIEKALLTYRNYDRQAIIKNAERFSIEKQAAEHLRLYEEIING